MKEKTDPVIGAFVIHNGKLLLVHHSKLDKWLPPGGHMEPNETPDEAVKREVKEETGLDVKFMMKEEVPKDRNIIEQLALPFYANVHNVGDHNHSCLFYLCRPNHDRVKISNESKSYRWVTSRELARSGEIPSDVKKIGRLAFKKMNSLKS